MKITSISTVRTNNYNNSNIFKGKSPKGINGIIKNGVFVAIPISPVIGDVIMPKQIDDTQKWGKNIKDFGVKDYKIQDGIVYFNLESGGFFKVNTFVLNNHEAENLILKDLKSDVGKPEAYRIKNFKNCVDSLGRFDIVSKGLRWHKFELQHKKSSTLSKAAKDLSKNLNKKIPPYRLFVMDNEAFYYDRDEKTVYSTIFTDKNIKPKDITRCKFIFDDQNNLIGYSRTKYDMYIGRPETEEYIEQQKPSEELPSVVDISETSRFTEACRFGNSTFKDRMTNAVENILLLITMKEGQKVNKEDLQYIKFNNNGKIQTVIGYYNPRSGISSIFDTEGKYCFSVKYKKNEYGEYMNFHTFK